MRYKEIEVVGEIHDVQQFEKAADEVLNIIQKYWENECVKFVIEEDSVVGHTRGKHKVRVFTDR